MKHFTKTLVAAGMIMLCACAGFATTEATTVTLAEFGASALPKTIVGMWMPPGETTAPLEQMDAVLGAAKKAGVNTVYVDTWYRGTVPYRNSKIAESSGEARKNPKYLHQLVGLVKKHGMRAEAYMDYGFWGGVSTPSLPKDSQEIMGLVHATRDMYSLDAAGNWLVSVRNPQDNTYSLLCPANPKSQKMFIDLCCEVLDKEQWDGLNIERYWFNGPNYCHCDYCKKHFKQDTGMELSDDMSPTDVKWTEFSKWRGKQIDRLMTDLSEAVRSKHKNMTVSATVYGVDDNEQQNLSVFWPGWLERKQVDYVICTAYGPGRIDFVKKWLEEHPQYRDRLVVGVMIKSVAEIPGLSADVGRGISLWHLGTVRELLLKHAE